MDGIQMNDARYIPPRRWRERLAVGEIASLFGGSDWRLL
jgi:hypothetical protein